MKKTKLKKLFLCKTNQYNWSCKTFTTIMIKRKNEMYCKTEKKNEMLD